MKIDPDSLIFDMDGTLWDAVDSYCKVWDKTFQDLKLNHKPVTRQTLMNMMGMHLEDIVANLAADVPDKELFLKKLDNNERTMMPVLGGNFYPHMKETIETVSRGRKIFMVSNCGSHGLENFINLAGIKPYITEALSHGGTGADKATNIAYLIDKYNLSDAWYVGDTQGDYNATVKAGAHFIWCEYGFGKVINPHVAIQSISQLTEIVTIH